MRSVIVLAGASGAGKTSVAAEILSKSQDFRLIRSATTRPPRRDGHDGEYLYFNEEEFRALIKENKLLEYMNYGGNFYGTPYSEIENAFSDGKTPLLILDLEGVKSLRKKSFDFSVFCFYIYDGLNVIERRLYDRYLLKNPTAEALESFLKRKAANIRDYLSLPELADKFDAFILNKEIAECAEEVLKLHREFSLGKEKNGKENTKIAEELSFSAKQKQ